MARLYSKRKVILSLVLEKVLFVLFYPLLLRSNRKNSCINSILLVEPFQMGDILSLTPLIEPLKLKFPQCEIYFLTKPSSGAILNYDSRVKKVFTADFPWADHGKKKMSFSRIISVLKYSISLRKNHFDLGIDTRGDVRSQALLILTGCRIRLGYVNYLQSNINLSGHLLTSKMLASSHKHRFEWNLNLLALLGIGYKELFPIHFPTFFTEKIQPAKNIFGRFILLHVGGGWVYRRWPEDKWIKLINHLCYESWDRIVVIGGIGETDILKRIETGVEDNDKLVFEITTLEVMVIYVMQCSKMISLDSGPMNLAVCLDKEIVALFGPGDSAMWSPLNQKGKFIQKTERFPCSPCLQLDCIFPKQNCMHEIEVEDVVSLL